MKKLPILFASVLLTAALSAFTTKQPTTDAFRLEDGSFIFAPVEGGTCQEHESFACEYTWTGAVDNNPQNPLNYQAVPGKENQFYSIP